MSAQRIKTGFHRLGMTLMLALMCGALVGCSSKQMTQVQYRALVDGRVQLGMSAVDVERELGVPQKKERVGTTEFSFYTPAYYLPSFWIASHNPIAIRDKKVVGMGKAYYDGVVNDANNS